MRHANVTRCLGQSTWGGGGTNGLAGRAGVTTAASAVGGGAQGGHYGVSASLHALLLLDLASMRARLLAGKCVEADTLCMVHGNTKPHCRVRPTSSGTRLDRGLCS